MIRKTKTEILDKLKTIVEKGGPTRYEYHGVRKYVDLLAKMVNDGALSKEEIYAVLNGYELLSNTDSLLGHIHLKPHGYAGDYQIIDWMYQKEIRNLGQPNWDLFILNQPAAIAVRNRKTYFITLVNQLFSEKKQIELCNVASGPGRDLSDLYSQLPDGCQLYTTCIERDKYAINHAEILTEPYNTFITYINKNIFKFQTTKKYDIVWSAGLFDYFNDRTFVLLLRRFKEWLNPGGVIVVGNFNDDINPSRNFMELFGSWYLNHRNDAHLRHLAQEAGFDAGVISIGREEENINLFLHIHIR
ncbi:MAG TPA: class I SAM-dependent methyltransferase [Pseudosphingobacterium sp.]|nr:class I SAM-dependent methyltransferase [Pseudosphingobacterium sp.]